MPQRNLSNRLPNTNMKPPKSRSGNWRDILLIPTDRLHPPPQLTHAQKSNHPGADQIGKGATISSTHLEVNIGSETQDGAKVRVAEDGPPLARAVLGHAGLERGLLLGRPPLLGRTHPTSSAHRGAARNRAPRQPTPKGIVPSRHRPLGPAAFLTGAIRSIQARNRGEIRRGGGTAAIGARGVRVGLRRRSGGGGVLGEGGMR